MKHGYWRTVFWAALSIVGTSIGASTSAMATITEQNFQVNNTKDLLDLCSASSNDPMMTAAVNFCQGFTVGAFQYHTIAQAASNAPPLFCLPNPRPSRNDAIAQFVKWGKSRPDVMSKPAVEGMFEFLNQQYPCQR